MYIAIDVGNVLCNVKFDEFASLVARGLNENQTDVIRRINKWQKMNDTGLVTMSDILENEFHITSSIVLQELSNVWKNDVLYFNDEVMEYIEELSSKYQISLALLSNVGVDHFPIIDKYINHNNYKHFEWSIKYYSCNVGVRKPQSLYYQSFLGSYPDFNKALYLDDLKENREMADNFGFHSIDFNLNYGNINSQCNNIRRYIENKESLIAMLDDIEIKRGS
jgi:FMN phosphatase YigB (HAD superfamily)